jgi:hypothetical protein
MAKPLSMKDTLESVVSFSLPAVKIPPMRIKHVPFALSVASVISLKPPHLKRHPVPSRPSHDMRGATSLQSSTCVWFCLGGGVGWRATFFCLALIFVVAAALQKSQQLGRLCPFPTHLEPGKLSLVVPYVAYCIRNRRRHAHVKRARLLRAARHVRELPRFCIARRGALERGEPLSNGSFAGVLLFLRGGGRGGGRVGAGGRGGRAGIAALLGRGGRGGWFGRRRYLLACCAVICGFCWRACR